jgi:hypothetical protein
MPDAKLKEETDRLYALLTGGDIPMTVAASGFKDFSEAAKDEVAARLARQYLPELSPPTLGHVLLLRTAKNEAALRLVFVSHLRAADARARKSSLVGLKSLGHPALADLALLSMRDDQDAVLAMAIDALLPAARADRALWTFLQGYYAVRKPMGDAFHTSIALLEAHGFPGAYPGK